MRFTLIKTDAFAFGFKFALIRDSLRLPNTINVKSLNGMDKFV